MAGQSGDVTNVKLGLANVEFGGVALGLSKGGIVVNIAQSVIDVVVDNWGDTPVNSFDKGVTVEAVIPMAEETLEKFNLALPTSVLTGSGKLTLGSVAGNAITPGKLVVNPVTAGRPNVVIYRARPTSEIAYSFTLDDVSILTVTFVGLIDSARPDGDQLFRIGGPSS